jgi:beta-mannosidase
VWKPVTLIAWNKIQIEDVHAIQEELSNSVAKLNFVFKVTCTEEGDYVFSVISDKAIVAEKSVHLVKGFQNDSMRMEIKNPKRWWTNGIGDANLYSFNCSVKQNNKALDSKNISIGLRTVEFLQEKDSIGKSFYFKVNGAPVFMKGANWIPADNFLPRVSKEKYRQLLTAAKDANMNMLRVWGGGVYESDDFYSLCDSLGILVWQDFMFACAMYPGDTAFTSNVMEEVKESIARLRNHPCLALWCGNNEIDEGWNNWGWQEKYHYNSSDSIKVWNDYKNLFEKVLPDVVKENDSRNYISTSPMHGWGKKESMLEGDSHYWGVWWGMQPFQVYERKIGRFMSEYGFQGMPALSTFKKFCGKEELTLTSDAVKNHQKHPAGYETIQNYLERDYRQPKDFENYIYVSQVLQAEGIKSAIEAHRKAKPYCMGTLYWQFNDCWPVTSWSSMDYEQNPKALQYIARNAYAKYLVSAENKYGELRVIVVSDDTAKVNARLKIVLEDFDGNIIRVDSGNVTVDNEMSGVAFRVQGNQFVSNTYYAKSFVKMELTQNGKLLAENVFYFYPPKNLLLKKTDIKYSFISAGKNEFSLTLSSETLAKNVFIDFGETKVALSDNYFDLFPKEDKTITVSSGVSLKELQKNIRIKSLVDSY